MVDRSKVGKLALEELAPPRVLVAIINNLRDFALARDQGWYRIPVRRAPAQIGAEYLAFYHTAAFEAEKWSIRYYAPIHRYRLVTRVELLPDEPAHPRANERYYCVDIGPLLELPHPVPSLRLRRITFIMTTLPRLLSAQEVNDLWEPSCTQVKLWQAFCAQPNPAEHGLAWYEAAEYYVAAMDQCPLTANSHTHFFDRPLPPGLIPFFTQPRHDDGSPCCLALLREAAHKQRRLTRVRGWRGSRQPRAYLERSQ